MKAGLVTFHISIAPSAANTAERPPTSRTTIDSPIRILAVRMMLLAGSRQVFTDVPPSQKRWGPRNGVSFPLHGARSPDAGKGKLTPLSRSWPRLRVHAHH